jgi:hypothetical protein
MDQRRDLDRHVRLDTASQLTLIAVSYDGCK